MWKPYWVTPDDKESHTDCSLGKQVQTELESQLSDHIVGEPLQKYWEDHKVISKGTSYDRTALGLARAKKSHQRQMWESKLTANYLPMGNRMYDRTEWPDNQRPRICGHKKDSKHVLQCPCGQATWADLQKIVFKWASVSKVAQGLAATLFTGLNQWRGFPVKPVEDLELPEVVFKAYHVQAKLGWEAAMKGFLAIEWCHAHETHFKHTNSRRSGVRTIAARIQKLWDIAWDMWEHRNHVFHLRGVEDIFQISTRLKSRIQFHHNKGQQGLNRKHNNTQGNVAGMHHPCLPELLKESLHKET
eukprot:6161008-Ditylum_brightwellii.AAC.1